MTQPDTLTALEGKWIREELCKCRVGGINPEAVKDLNKAAESALVLFEYLDQELGGELPCDDERFDDVVEQIRAALAKAKLP